MEYEILGVYKFNEVEVIDYAETKMEAIRLVHEYRIAYGNEWNITCKRKTK
jgi:hypothetical protein